MDGKNQQEVRGQEVHEQDIENIVRMLDAKAEAGIIRLNLQVIEKEREGAIDEIYHHGRCDVGSPWAKGTVTNFDEIDEKE